MKPTALPRYPALTWTRRNVERRGRWLWGSLAFFFALGPVLILLHLGDWLELATVLWGYYHVFKQHYGFMMMYKKKNRDFLPEDMKLDKVFFAAGVLLPFPHLSVAQQGSARPSCPSRFRRAWLPPMKTSCCSSLILVTLAYVVRQVQKWRQGLSLELAEAASFRVCDSGQLPALSQRHAAAGRLCRGHDFSQRPVPPAGVVL